MSTAVHITLHGAQIKFGDLPPYLTYDRRYPAWYSDPRTPPPSPSRWQPPPLSRGIEMVIRQYSMTISLTYLAASGHSRLLSLILT